MKAFAIFIFFGFLILGCDATEPEPTYTLTLSISGDGSCQINPDKTQYNKDESVSLIASPDSGWGFVSWVGNLNSQDNPVNIIMNGNKNITAIFGETYLPEITGQWGGVQWIITLDLVQETVFNSYFIGQMVAELIGGGTLEYSVTGHNTPPNVSMTMTKTGYYPLNYIGVWLNESTIDGNIEENNIFYELDLVKVGGIPIPNNRAKINIGKKAGHQL